MKSQDATWMSNPYIQNKSISDIVIPGSHDSGTWNLSSSLSTIKYSDNEVLWKLSREKAKIPKKGILPIDDKWCVGDVGYDFIMNLVSSMAKTESLDIEQQLNGGLRYFDLRVYYDENVDDVHLQHTLRCGKFSETLRQVSSFIKSQPNGKELIFLDLSHANFADFPKGMEIVEQNIREILGEENVCTLGVLDFSEPLNLARLLKDKTLSDITNGSSKVILLNTDSKYAYSNFVIKSNGFTKLSDSTKSSIGPVMTLNELAYSYSASNQEYIDGVLDFICGKNEPLILQGLCLKKNKMLRQDVEKYSVNQLSLITVDWFDFSDVVQICIDRAMDRT